MLIDEHGSRVDQAAGLRRLMARTALRMVAVLDATDDALVGRLGARLGEQSAPALVMGASGGAVQQCPGGAVSEAQARALALADSAQAVAWLCSADVRFVLAWSAQVPEQGPAAFAPEVVLVLDVEPQSQMAAQLTAAYGTLKQLHARSQPPRCHILVRGGTADSAPAMFSRLESVASRFLGMGLGFVGHVPLAAQGRAVQAHNAEADVARRLVALVPA